MGHIVQRQQWDYLKSSFGLAVKYKRKIDGIVAVCIPFHLHWHQFYFVPEVIFFLCLSNICAT